MVEDHWQIYHWHGNKVKDGRDEAVPINEVPPKILKIAQRAANLIGDGFYGIDIKDCNGTIMVIEINDNPSIDYGVEDAILKDDLYLQVMQYMLNRIKLKKQ
jgi:glutathione synthase/RimK-type ligase-like ATP-grasp enzyme